jgi:hypothetical protein
MNTERWQKVEAVLQAALDRPVREREAFVAEACSGDADLGREVSSLAAAYEAAHDFIEESALSSDVESW